MNMEDRAGARIAAETFPPIEFLREELDARGWSAADLLDRIPDHIDQLAVILMLKCSQKGMLVGEDVSATLGKALGVSPELFLNLDRAWQPEEYAKYESRLAKALNQPLTAR